MKIKDILNETFSSITANKGRTVLTVLGIVIGIGSVIAMLSIGESAKQSIQGSVKSMGENVLQLSINRSAIKDSKQDVKELDNIDADTVRKMPEVKLLYELNQGNGKILYKNKSTVSTIMSFNTGFLEDLDFTAEYGSLFNTTTNENALRVVILGPEIAKKLNKNAKALVGEYVKINNVNFKVTGILKSRKDSLGLAQFDSYIYIPINTYQKNISGSRSLDLLWINANGQYDTQYIKDRLNEVLMKRRGLKDKDIEYFKINSQDDILSLTNTITSIFTTLLASVAGISLLVGGIGIMNMMLTIVTERTREIGLRKAIGATSANISIQFLAESILLTLIGGFFGILVGLGLAAIGTALMNVTNVVSVSSIFLAFFIAGGIGIIFGYYPAKRASKLNPIEALRYE